MSGDSAGLAGSAAGPGGADPCSWGTAPCTLAGRSGTSGLGRGRLTSRWKGWHVGSGLTCSSTQAVLSTGRNTKHSTQCLPDLGASNSTCARAASHSHRLRCACSSHRCRNRHEVAVCAKGAGAQFLQGGTNQIEVANMSFKSTAVGLDLRLAVQAARSTRALCHSTSQAEGCTELEEAGCPCRHC